MNTAKLTKGFAAILISFGFFAGCASKKPAEIKETMTSTTTTATPEDHQAHHPEGTANKTGGTGMDQGGKMGGGMMGKGGMMAGMDMNQMMDMMHECQEMHKDSKMCDHEMMDKCQKDMKKEDCQKMMKQAKKQEKAKKQREIQSLHARWKSHQIIRFGQWSPALYT